MPTRRLRFSLFVALAVALPATVTLHADTADSVDERLRRLESTVQTLQSENAALRRELGTQAAAMGTTPRIIAVTPVGREARLAVGGYIQGQAEFGDAADARFTGIADRFYFRRARIYVTGSFAEQFEFKVEGEYAANSLAATTGLRASANEIFIGWTRFPQALIRFGQLKPAFGGEQLASDTRIVAIERFLASDRLTDSRQLGVSVGGSFLANRLSYLVVIGNGNGSNVSANDNNKFMHTGRIAGVPLDDPRLGRVTVGVNAMHSDDAAVNRPGLGFDSVPGGALDNVFAGRRTGYGVDATWHLGRADIWAEYLRLHFQPRDRLPLADFYADGWQLMASYFVIPKTLQAVVRRESFDPNLSLTGDQTNNWTLGGNYLIKGEDLRLMVDYLFGHNPDAAHDRGRLLTRFQVLF